MSESSDSVLTSLSAESTLIGCIALTVFTGDTGTSVQPVIVLLATAAIAADTLTVAALDNVFRNPIQWIIIILDLNCKAVTLWHFVPTSAILGRILEEW